MRERRLIINADDYGICREVNASVEELAEAGMLGGVSLLANGVEAAAAMRYLQQHPALCAGAHLNAVEGRPLSAAPEVEILTGKDGTFSGLAQVMQRWLLHPHTVTRALETEWRAQLERLLAAGLTLHHLDSHQHLHAFPPAFACAVKLARAYGIKALRWPGERVPDRLRLAGALALRASLAVARRLNTPAGLRCNEHFLGFRQAGGYNVAKLLNDIAALPAGVTELAVHPSQQDRIPYPAYRGRGEHEALLDAHFRQSLPALDVKLISWTEA